MKHEVGTMLAHHRLVSAEALMLEDAYWARSAERNNERYRLPATDQAAEFWVTSEGKPAVTTRRIVSA